jgi:hypothetical protein
MQNLTFGKKLMRKGTYKIGFRRNFKTDYCSVSDIINLMISYSDF